MAKPKEKEIDPRWVITFVLAGLVAAITIFLRIPIPKSGGYLNLGDVVIVFAGLYLGPVGGLAVGGIGSAVADAFGYPVFVVPTLIIKGLEGLLSGVKIRGLGFVGPLLGGVTMVVGYYIVEAFVFGNLGPAAAKAELPFNVIQGAVGVAGGYILYRVIRRWTEDDQ